MVCWKGVGVGIMKAGYFGDVGDPGDAGGDPALGIGPGCHFGALSGSGDNALGLP